MPQKVVILGGGVAGLSAAHELLERGFVVEVFEKLKIPGRQGAQHPGSRGARRPRSQVRACRCFRAAMAADPLGGGGRLPGEHGFRFFPNFYRHITDTLRRIPFGNGTVFDNLVDTTQVLVASYDKPGVELPSRFPENVYELASALKTFLWTISPRNDIPYADVEHFAGCVWRIITSCEERRFEEYEKIDWWDFVGAENRSEAYQRLLAIGITRSLVAAKARVGERQDDRRYLRPASVRHPGAGHRLGPAPERADQPGLDPTVAQAPDRDGSYLSPRCGGDGRSTLRAAGSRVQRCGWAAGRCSRQATGLSARSRWNGWRHWSPRR